MADSLLESLYTEELYQVNTKTFVIITIPWHNVTEDERQLLSKIVGAVRLSIDAIQIVEQPKFDLGSLPDKPSRIIYFGNAVPGLVLYEVIQTANTSLVLSASLQDLLADEPSRKNLWLALKQLFGV